MGGGCLVKSSCHCQLFGDTAADSRYHITLGSNQPKYTAKGHWRGVENQATVSRSFHAVVPNFDSHLPNMSLGRIKFMEFANRGFINITEP